MLLHERRDWDGERIRGHFLLFDLLLLLSKVSQPAHPYVAIRSAIE